ncbi:MAG: PqqD family protein, partial [Dorea sp.]
MMEQRFVARKGFLVREIAGEFMLVPVDTGGVYQEKTGEELPEFNGVIQLDEVGAFLWNELESPKTIKALVDAVTEEFDTEGQDITEDICEFLDIGIKSQVIFILKRMIREE